MYPKLSLIIVVILSFSCVGNDVDDLFDAGSGKKSFSPNCVRYVDPESSESGDGLSWTTAFSSVEEAAAVLEENLANIETCEIWVRGTAQDDGYIDALTGVANRIKLFDGFKGNEQQRGSSKVPFVMANNTTPNFNSTPSEIELARPATPQIDELGHTLFSNPIRSSSSPYWGYSNPHLYYNDGYIGIGTSSPQGGLHIRRKFHSSPFVPYASCEPPLTQKRQGVILVAWN